MLPVRVEAIDPFAAEARPERKPTDVVRLELSTRDLGLVGVREEDGVRSKARERRGADRGVAIHGVQPSLDDAGLRVTRSGTDQGRDR